jgi:hypothetical protein
MTHSGPVCTIALAVLDGASEVKELKKPKVI